MKKLIALISIFALALMFTSCGGPDEPELKDLPEQGIELPIVPVPFD